MQALASWSGGKDSCYAVMQAKKNNFSPVVLLNVLNEEGKISRSHGLPLKILQAQSVVSGIPLKTINSSWDEYEKKFIAALDILREEYDLTYAIFGDIDLQAHRDWEEKVCDSAGLEAVLPLWQQDRRQLVHDMLDAGIETMIVSCNTVMGENFLGKLITRDLITDLEKLGIDPCGENGEYHTLVLNCPLFSERLHVIVTEKLLHADYWFARV